jgi:hypothetical protein
MTLLYSRNWDDNLITNQTLYGTGAAHAAVGGKLRLTSTNPYEAKSVMLDAGSIADFDATFTLTLPPINNDGIGFIYRTNPIGWVNTNNGYGYILWFYNDSVYFYKGTNDGSAGVSFLTSNYSGLSAGETFNARLKVFGPYHKCWINNKLILVLYDSSFLYAGQMAFYLRSSSGTKTSDYDNFVLNSAETNEDFVSLLGRYDRNLHDTSVFTRKFPIKTSYKDLTFNSILWNPGILLTKNPNANAFGGPVKRNDIFNKMNVVPDYINNYEKTLLLPWYYDYNNHRKEGLIIPNETLLPDNTGRIKGRVDVFNIPQPNILVNLYYNVNGNKINSVITDENGEYEFYGLKSWENFYQAEAHIFPYNAAILDNIMAKSDIIPLSTAHLSFESSGGAISGGISTFG